MSVMRRFVQVWRAETAGSVSVSHLFLAYVEHSGMGGMTARNVVQCMWCKEVYCKHGVDGDCTSRGLLRAEQHVLVSEYGVRCVE
jgi:hypothetical protein